MLQRDEEEMQNYSEFLGSEEAGRSLFFGGSEEQLNRAKQPGCRNAPNRIRKRKITWQDQVALRV